MRFDSYHPAINLIFFAAVIASTVMWNHPVFLGVSWACAFAYSVKLNGRRAVAFDCALVPAAALVAAWFAMNEHFGVTNLGKTVIGNNVTLESLVAGAAQGVMLAAVIMWASCVFAVFTADKVVYLVGRVSPRLSLFLSIALRCVPVAKAQARRIAAAQRCIGRGVRQGGAARRARNVVRIASILVSWLIERVVLMSDSMRSRGVGLRGRTAYAVFRFDNRDRSVVIALVALVTVCGCAMALDQTSILYDPMIVMNRVTPASFVFYAAYAALCLMPLVLQAAGERRFARQVAECFRAQ